LSTGNAPTRPSPAVLKTKYLFLILLHDLRRSIVLDVGSLDGADSLRFRAMLPDAKIFAFEANPYLYTKRCLMTVASTRRTSMSFTA
jgi:hypothetical protein